MCYAGYRLYSTPSVTLSSLPTGGHFSLQGKGGELNTKELEYDLILIYFGYTFCPDVCPTTLSSISAAFKLMSEDELKRIGMIFITLDPKRDTLDRMATYTQFFHEKIDPAVGPEEVVQDIANHYGVAYEKFYPDGDNKTYSLDHSTQTFLVNSNAEVIDILSHGSTHLEIVNILRRHLKKEIK